MGTKSVRNNGILRVTFVLNLCDLPSRSPAKDEIYAIPAIGGWYLIAGSLKTTNYLLEKLPEVQNDHTQYRTFAALFLDCNDAPDPDSISAIFSGIGFTVQKTNTPPWL